MDVYNQFIDPSTCQVSIACNFTGENVSNLVVSKGTILQVFEIIEVSSADDEEDDTVEAEALAEAGTFGNDLVLQDELVSSSGGFVNKKYNLSMISEYRMNGQIINIDKFRSNEDETRDYLIISSKNAKISIVSWDPSNRCISTVSLHYYEQALESLSLENTKDAEVRHRTDPNGVCTAVEMNGVFCVLPFYKDELVDGEVRNETVNANELNSEEEESKHKKIYNSSFLMSSSSFNSGIKEIIDFQFLHSYREPTVAILYSSKTPTWAGYLKQSEDNLKLIIVSLNMETKQATTIMEVDNLPFDLEKIYAVPSPVNGLILLGSNEIIYVNSLGSTRGFSVNSFFEKISHMQLNRSKESLELMLEGSVMQYLSQNEILLVTSTGQFVSLTFENIGGTYALTDINLLQKKQYEKISIVNPLCITSLPESCFVCSESGDSVLLGWKNTGKFSSANNQVQGKVESIIETTQNIEEDDDSWLYKDEDADKEDLKTTNGSKSLSQHSTTSLANAEFYIMDSLINCGPLSHFTTAPISAQPKKKGLPNPNLNNICILGTSGVGETGAISVFSPTVEPIIESSLKFSNVDRIWTLSDSNGKSHYLITTDKSILKTQIFLIGKNYKDYFTKDFDTNSVTVAIGCVGSLGLDDKSIVQVTPHKVTLFDFKFRQIDSMEYENEIISAQIRGNLVLLVMEHGEAIIYELNQKKEKNSKKDVKKDKKDKKLKNTSFLKKLKIPKVLDESEGLIFTGGWIARSSILNHVKIGSAAVKRTHTGRPKFDVNQEDTTQKYIFFLTTGDNRILTFDKKHDDQVFELQNVDTLQNNLEFSLMDQSLDREPDPSIKQIMFTKLGDSSSTTEYLVILTFGGEIILYENYFDPEEKIYKLIKINEVAQLPVTGGPDNAYSYGTTTERKLVKLKNWQGYESIAVTGTNTYCILKPHQTMPKVFQFTSLPTLSFAEFTVDPEHLSTNQVIFIDGTKAARICRLDLDYNYSTRYPVKKIHLGETPNAIAYHKKSKSFVVSTLSEVPFVPLDDDGEPLKGSDPELATEKRSKTYSGSIKLISPVNFSVIDSVKLDDYEVCTSLKSMDLDVHKDGNAAIKSSREFISLGTSILRLEEVATTGAYKLFEIIDIVPEPGRPEADRRLKLFSTEKFKGAAASTCAISGRHGVVQGQRLLIRNIYDNQNVTPVAFLDTSIYAKELKAFEDLVLVGDVEQSVSLYGFDASPYRTMKLSMDVSRVKVIATDFIIFDSSLFILSADEEGVLHVLQYDPSDPNSLQGFKLVRKTVFRHNGYTTHMVSIPRKDSLFSLSNTLNANKTNAVLGYETIASNIDGSFYRITPVPESTYRRLYAVQQQIYDREAHWAGLNPRMNAIGNLESIMPVIPRPMIELNVAKKYINMNYERKRNIANRLGKNSYAEIYREFIILG